MYEKNYNVYIMASKKNGTLYVGVTSKLRGRVFEHKHNKMPNSFTSRYDVTRLVYYETHYDVYKAIHREKQLKRWRRSWKIRLIEAMNPLWLDLYERIRG